MSTRALSLSLAQRSAIGASVVLGALLAPLARACPEKLPSGMTAVSVGEHLSVNKLGVAILQVESRESMTALLKRTGEEWQAAGYAVKLNQAAGWHVVSALSEKCVTTLQLVERNGSFGYMAVNRLAKPMTVRLPEVPTPRGARILSNVLSDDDGRKASTTVLAASQSVARLASFYRQALIDGRWSGVRAVAGANDGNTPNSAIVSGQLGRERIEIVIVEDGGSRVVVNVATEL